MDCSVAAGPIKAVRLASKITRLVKLGKKVPAALAKAARSIGRAGRWVAEKLHIVGRGGARVPHGLAKEQWDAVSGIIRTGFGGVSDDIVVQGSRATGRGVTAATDLDVGIRISRQQFERLVRKVYRNVNPGSARWRQMQRALETGKLPVSRAGFRAVRNAVSEALGGVKVDMSFIVKNGPFDTGPFIPVK
jgi:hypothetical protein